jgi:hypothetical protein
MIVTRRDFGRLSAFAALNSLPRMAKAFAGPEAPPVGLHSYSLRTVPHDNAIELIIAAMQQIGLKQSELWSSQIEPMQPNTGAPRPSADPNAARPPLTPEQLAAQKAAAEALKSWRLTTPLSYFGGIGAKFKAAGLSITSYNARLGESDEEIDRTFLITKALGAPVVTARVSPALTDRVAAAAEKHKMVVGIQSTDADALASQLAKSSFFKIDLDIGDFTRAGHNALGYVQENYTKFSDIHLKDCKLNGPSVPFGEGDSHMKEILLFLKEKHATFPVYIDCDYPGTGTSVEEVQKCYAYVTRCLA